MKKGEKMSEESRRKMSEAHKGKVLTLEARTKLSEQRKGKPLSPETRAKLSVSRTGKVLTPEHRANISAGGKGLKRSDETRARIGAAKLGEKHPGWKGGRALSHGYVRIKNPGHPGADCNGYVMRARLVMEDHVGRYLSPEEIVHHVDANRANDALPNLCLFANQRDHLRHHASLRRNEKEGAPQ